MTVLKTECCEARNVCWDATFNWHQLLNYI